MTTKRKITFFDDNLLAPVMLGPTPSKPTIVPNPVVSTRKTGPMSQGPTKGHDQVKTLMPGPTLPSATRKKTPTRSDTTKQSKESTVPSIVTKQPSVMNAAAKEWKPPSTVPALKLVPRTVLKPAVRKGKKNPS